MHVITFVLVHPQLRYFSLWIIGGALLIPRGDFSFTEWILRSGVKTLVSYCFQGLGGAPFFLPVFVTGMLALHRQVQGGMILIWWNSEFKCCSSLDLLMLLLTIQTHERERQCPSGWVDCSCASWGLRMWELKTSQHIFCCKKVVCPCANESPKRLQHTHSQHFQLRHMHPMW